MATTTAEARPAVRAQRQTGGLTGWLRENGWLTLGVAFVASESLVIVFGDDPLSVPAPLDANLFSLANGPETFIASLRDPDGGPGSPVHFTFAGDAVELARHPDKYRFRYHVP